VNTIQSAIDQALAQHGAMREVLREQIDPVAIAMSCADRAAVCSQEQAGIAACLLLAAESIRRLTES